MIKGVILAIIEKIEISEHWIELVKCYKCSNSNKDAVIHYCEYCYEYLCLDCLDMFGCEDVKIPSGWSPSRG